MIKYNIIARKQPHTESVKYYASALHQNPLKLADLAESISSECTVTPHDIKAVISALEEKITEALLNGLSVRLGDLGSFHTTLQSEGTTQKEDFKTTNIRKVMVRFVKSAKMRFNFRIENPKVKFQLSSKKKKSE